MSRTRLVMGVLVPLLIVGACLVVGVAIGRFLVPALASAAVLEEVAFRALLFRIVEERIGVRTALVVSAIVSTAAHVPNGGFSSISVLTVALAGVMWAGVYVLSRNVWVTAAHHASWNATIFATGLPLSGEEAWRAQAPFQS